MNKNKGVTLIEVLVAIVVLVVALLALYSVIIYGITINLKAKYKATAYHIAQQEMEILRNKKFSQLTNINCSTIENPPCFLGSISDLDKLPQGEGKLIISDYKGNAIIKQVTVKVLWYEKGASQKKEVKLDTLISKGGLNPKE